MNVKDALAVRLPGVPLYEARPSPVPAGAYVIASELTDGREQDFFTDEGGKARQERRITLLLTLYGASGVTPTGLRAQFRSMKHLHELITEHPGLPPLARRVELGPVLPPTADPAGRTFAGVRLIVWYVE